MPAPYLVISFQRSGLNWLRYCTEYFTGIRTPGRPQLIAEGPVLFDRAHDVRRRTKRSDYAGLHDEHGTEIYERVALLLRHPFDCFASHYLGRADVNFRSGLKRFDAYSANILAFDGLSRARKALFYFEDFVSQERETLALLEFLQVETKGRDYDFEKMKENSRAWYSSTHGLFESRERPILGRRQRAAIARRLKEQLGSALEEYLGRYSLDA